jgi:hypothetical protein
MTATGKPDPGPVIDLIVVHLSSLGLTRDHIDAINYMLPMRMYHRTAARATPEHHRYLLKLIDYSVDLDNPDHLTRGFHVHWQILGNPLLCFMEQMLMAFVAHLCSSQCFRHREGVPAIQVQLRAKHYAAMAGNWRLVEELDLDIYRRARALFEPV